MQFRNIIHFHFALPALGLTLVLSACVNGKGRVTSSSSDSQTTSGINVVTSVLKDTFDPGGTLDLVGDGTGSIGSFCPMGSTSSPAPSTTSTTSATNCTCHYSYTTADGSSEAYDAPSTYSEPNLLRCSYNYIDTAYMQVSINFNNGTFSNQIVFPMNGAGGALNVLDPSSYAQVNRYQCRDSIFVPYLFYNTIYDPVVSDDINMSYPLNFYSTNYGGTFSLYSGSGITMYNCPSLPNDPSAGMDINLYSVVADSAGSNLIYPPASGDFDRSTFNIAKQLGGVFTVPVDAYLAPGAISGLATTTSGSNLPPLGYGASPISTGDQTETCPTNVAIPTGFHWVKVWLFGANLNVRYYHTSTVFAPTNTFSIGQVGCNPGAIPDGTGHHVFADCPTASARILPTSKTSGKLADRVLAPIGVCTNMGSSAALKPCNGLGAGCTTQSSGTALLGGLAQNYPLGSDVSPPDQIAIKCPTNADVAHLCEGNNVPYDNATQLVQLDPNPRSDFVFVVTPITVNSLNMRTLGDPIGQMYTPYRYTQSGCNPQTAGCQPVVYGLKLHDVSTNGDPPADDPNRPGVFPVCALQPGN